MVGRGKSNIMADGDEQRERGEGSTSRGRATIGPSPGEVEAERTRDIYTGTFGRNRIEMVRKDKKSRQEVLKCRWARTDTRDLE